MDVDGTNGTSAEKNALADSGRTVVEFHCGMDERRALELGKIPK
jgi:hypothetical protein